MCGEPILTTLKSYLRRYTNIPALICLLREQRITLLDPETWDDKNDSHFLKLYQEKNGFQSVLALCFTRTSETYRHWRVFANGSSGVCVTFKRDQLLHAVGKQTGIRCGIVKYLTLAAMRRTKLAVRDLPFWKRYPFEHEREFRIIYESRERSRAIQSLFLFLSRSIASFVYPAGITAIPNLGSIVLPQSFREIFVGPVVG